MCGECATRPAAGTPRRASIALTSLVAVFALVIAGLPPQRAHGASCQQPSGADCLADDAGVLDFLRDAEIVDDVPIGIGITKPRRLTLEQNGARMLAAFRYVDETHTSVRMRDGRFYRMLRDYSGFEVAAYRLSSRLGMNSVPPATRRTVRGKPGTVQVWIGDAMMERARLQKGLTPPNALHWHRQRQEMYLFDELIGNIDRTQENMLIDQGWKLWLIDHTRAFQQGRVLHRPDRLQCVRRGFWEALLALDRATVEEAVGDELRRSEVAAVLARRDLLVAYIGGLIAQRGESAVLWE